MSWISKTFASSIGRKIVMSLTGLFLCTFLVVHLVGNLQLFKHDGGVAFNSYSHFMGTNPIIRTIEWGLVLGFGFHIYEALMLTRRNQGARPQKYVVSHAEQNSEWTSRNMGICWAAIHAHLPDCAFHTISGWRSRFGILGGLGRSSHQRPDRAPYDDLYSVASSTAFQNVRGTWRCMWLAQVARSATTSGTASARAFQTLGLNHRKYMGAHSSNFGLRLRCG